MEIELADRLDGAPELRLASYAYRDVFGRSPAQVWRVPGTVTLLAAGPRQLTVAARWGAVVAAGPRPDAIIESIRTSRPDQKVQLTVAEAAAGAGPSWAAEGLRSARTGAALLVNSDLPEGSGPGAYVAIQAAIRLALLGLAEAGDADGSAGKAGPAVETDGHQPGMALLDGRLLPFDLHRAALRLLVIDTRVRGFPQQPPAENSPVDDAAAALESGAIEALGPMLTGAHAAPNADEAQQVTVSAALGAGALGARMITDGPGRPTLALLPAQRLTEVRNAISGALQARGLRPARFLTVAPAGGAHQTAGGGA